MSPSPVELVVFDIGGVLVKVAESWAETLRRAGVDAPPALLARMAEVDWVPVMVAYETGRLEPEAFAERVVALSGLEVDAVRRVMDAWLVGPYDGVEELVEALERAPVETACLSNTNARHWALMTGRSHSSIPLARLDYRFASHQIGHLKPGAEAYAAVERGTGRSAEAILFFDDREPNVAAALARGWQGVVVDPAGDPVAAVRAELAARGVLAAAP